MARVTCPRCRLSTPWTGNPHRPFCSLTCRLIDLGAWLDERYRIAAEPAPDAPAVAEGERVSEEGERVS